MAERPKKKFDVSKLSGMFVDDAEDLWRKYRRLVRKNEVDPIRSESLVRAMFSAMIRDTLDQDYIKKKGISIVDQLRQNKDLLETDIWMLFEFKEFPHGWNLTSWDIHFSSWEKEERKGEDWKGSICTLIKEGDISKEGIIDGCFRSLSQPFTDFESKWYVGLLDLMIKREIITPEEQSKDSRFLALLENPNPSPRSLGLKVLEQLAKSNLIGEEEVLRFIPSLFLEPAKGKAKKALTLLEKIAKKNKTLQSDVCRTALEGLRHEATEIQQGSLDLLLKYDAFSDPEITKSVQELEPSLAASVRRNIPGQKESAIKPANKSEQSFVPEMPQPIEIYYEPINPIETFDELFDLAVKLVEKAEDIDEIERFLDGLSRLGTLKPDDFAAKAKPLLARIQKKNQWDSNLVGVKGQQKYNDWPGPPPFSGHIMRTDIHYLIAGWITNSSPTVAELDTPLKITYYYWCDDTRIEGNEYRFSLHFAGKSWVHHEFIQSKNPIKILFSERVKGILNSLLAEKLQQRLSTPTHRNGWIDPAIFVQRLIESQKNNVEHDEHDKVLALLRLRPDGREAALKQLDTTVKKRDDYCNAVRYALGAEKVKIGSTAHYWIAAARCRNPFENDPDVEKAFPNFGPDAGTAARYSFETKELKYYGNTIAVRCSPETTLFLIDTKAAEISLFPSVSLHYATSLEWDEPPGYFSWLNSVWPQNLDPAIVAGINSNSRNIEKSYDKGFRHIFALMSDTAFPLHSIGISALFLGLSGKSSLVFTPSMDTLIAMIADRRLISKAAVVPIRDLLQIKALTTSRWTSYFKTISEQSELHAVFVFEVLEEILDLLPMREIGSFLEILHEIALSLNRPITSESCLRFLKSFSGSGKAAKLAKKLLE